MLLSPSTAIAVNRSGRKRSEMTKNGRNIYWDLHLKTGALS